MIFLLSCRMSDPTTLVDELRIMGIRTNPAEISIEELFAPESTPPLAEFWIANPEDLDLDLLLWSCTNFGEGCLEQDVYTDDPESWITLLEDVDSKISTPFGISPITVGIVSDMPVNEQPFSGTALWALACKRNTCSIIDDAKNGSIDMNSLADPFTLMSSLPLEDATLSFRNMYFSNRDESERIQHPQITPNFGGIPNLPLDEFVDLNFSYQLSQPPNEDSRAFAYTTHGGFAPNEDINNQLLKQESDVALRWFAPTSELWEQPPLSNAVLEDDVLAESTLFVFIDDGMGGLGVWNKKAYLLSSNVSPE